MLHSVHLLHSLIPTLIFCRCTFTSYSFIYLFIFQACTSGYVCCRDEEQLFLSTCLKSCVGFNMVWQFFVFFFCNTQTWLCTNAHKVLLVWSESPEDGKGQRQVEQTGWSKETQSCSQEEAVIRSLCTVCVCLCVCVWGCSVTACFLLLQRRFLPTALLPAGGSETKCEEEKTWEDEFWALIVWTLDENSYLGFFL